MMLAHSSRPESMARSDFRCSYQNNMMVTAMSALIPTARRATMIASSTSMAGSREGAARIKACEPVICNQPSESEEGGPILCARSSGSACRRILPCTRTSCRRLRKSRGGTRAQPCIGKSRWRTNVSEGRFKGNNHLWISNPEVLFIGAPSMMAGAQESPISTGHSFFFPILDGDPLGKARKMRSMLEYERTP